MGWPYGSPVATFQSWTVLPSRAARNLPSGLNWKSDPAPIKDLVYGLPLATSQSRNVAPLSPLSRVARILPSGLNWRANPPPIKDLVYGLPLATSQRRNVA